MSGQTATTARTDKRLLRHPFAWFVMGALVLAIVCVVVIYIETTCQLRNEKSVIANVVLSIRLMQLTLGMLIGVIALLFGVLLAWFGIMSEVDASVDSSFVTAKLATTSPGIISIICGTILVCSTVLIRVDVDPYGGFSMFTTLDPYYRSRFPDNLPELEPTEKPSQAKPKPADIPIILPEEKSEIQK